MYSSTVSLTSALYGVGSQRHAPAALPRERPGTYCTGGWVAPGPVWTGAENLAPTDIRFPDRLTSQCSMMTKVERHRFNLITVRDILA